MIRHKLDKYAEIKNLPNVLECGGITYDPLVLEASWNDIPFRSTKPLVLELGCGRGEYTISMAERLPQKNFIGIDIKGVRLWFGAKHALEQGLGNLMFIRMQIDHIDSFFPPKSVDEIWIPFPDPHTNHAIRNAKKRLTSPVFLNRYKNIIKDDGIFHLKTDHDKLYDYTLKILAETGAKVLFCSDDLYKSGLSGEVTNIQTTFEKRYLKKNIPIKYIKFTL